MVAFAAAVFVVAAFALARTVQAASEPQVAAGQHVLTVYDGGVERGVLTEADTLGEALEQAGIGLSEHDITEPSRDEELVAGSYSVNIYRARPVVVQDGSTRTKVMTPYQTGEQVAKQAGIELHEEDRATLASTATEVMTSGALERLEIDRATPVTLIYYGKKTEVFTHEETVADLLASKDIELQDNDTLSVDRDAKITKNMTIELWRNGKQTITEEQDVAFEVEQIEDADRPAGYREVKTPGKKGKKTVTYEVVMKNGKESSRKEIGSVVTQKPTKQVVIVGTKPSFSGDFAAALSKLRACESGGNYSTNTGNGYYGAYQYDIGTWGGYGGYSNAAEAPAAVQDQKARETYEARGWSPWPSCGSSLPDTYR